MDRIFKFLLELPDKVAHILVCFVGCVFFNFPFGLGASLAAEFKDRAHGGLWDWKDFWAGMLGTLLGSMVNGAIIYMIWR